MVNDCTVTNILNFLNMQIQENIRQNSFKPGIPVPVQGIFFTEGAMEQKIRIISTESMVVKALPVLIQTNQPIKKLRPTAKAHKRQVSKCNSLRRCI
jgi:hypothetical protein